MLSRFHLIPERYGRTDGQTDRFAISISPVSMLMHDKNAPQNEFRVPKWHFSLKNFVKRVLASNPTTPLSAYGGRPQQPIRQQLWTAVRMQLVWCLVFKC